MTHNKEALALVTPRGHPLTRLPKKDTMKMYKILEER